MSETEERSFRVNASPTPNFRYVQIDADDQSSSTVIFLTPEEARALMGEIATALGKLNRRSLT